MKKKAVLKKNDMVGLIAPAGSITEEKLNNSVKNLEYLGLTPFYFNSVTDKSGYLAGTDKRRTDELLEMYKNKNVKAILSIRGGYGCMRILNSIDFNVIKRNPKPIIGYSDITALQSAIYKYTKQISFHGILGAEIFSDYTVENFKRIFFDDTESITISTNNSENKAYTITPGTVKGILTGGNLSLMVSLIGTKYDFNTKNKIICIEEVNEPPYKIDRMFTQLLMSGKLNQATGIILGQFNKCEPENFNINQKDSMHLKEILLEKIKPLNIPALYGFSFGHIREQAILPFGAHVNLNTELFQFSFKRKELKEFL